MRTGTRYVPACALANVGTWFALSMPPTPSPSAAGAVFKNVRGEILIVRPIYKDFWEMPGGVIEVHESPRAACEREVAEELGLAVRGLPLICVDYLSDRDACRFVFDGGVLDDATIERIRLPAHELSEWRFVPTVEARNLLNPRWSRRLDALERSLGTFVYLEDGTQP